MIRASIIVAMLATGAVASPELVGTARVGVAAYDNLDPDRDSIDLGGTGLSLGAELGLRFPALHLEPAIAIDVGQFSSVGNDVFEGSYTQRDRMIAITARLHLAVTDAIDVVGGVGETLVLEQYVDTKNNTNTDYYGLHHFEVGVGLRVWHDDRQAVRVELLARSGFRQTDVEQDLTQLGGSVGYSLRF